MKVVYTEAARDELLRAARHYAQQALGLKSEFIAEIRSVHRVLLQFPESAPRLRGEVRRAPLQRFPFSVLYAIRGQHLVVVAVMHDRQHPDYWLPRIGENKSFQRTPTVLRSGPLNSNR